MAYCLVERPCAPPLNARSMERLGSPFGWGSTVDDLEALADDWHSRAWHSSNAFAYSSEVCPMDFAPIAQRSIAFALGSGRREAAKKASQERIPGATTHYAQ